jgi:hypothetical protein
VTGVRSPGAARKIATYPRQFAADPARLGPSLRAYIGHPVYSLDTPRADLDRFAFLPSGNDGDHFLGPGQP